MISDFSLLIKAKIKNESKFYLSALLVLYYLSFLLNKIQI